MRWTTSARRSALSQALSREQEHLYFARIGTADRLWFANQTARAEELLGLCPANLRQWEWHYLDRLRRPDCVKLTDHTAELFSVAVSPDGQHFATGDNDGSVRLWDSRTHTTIRTWQLKALALRLTFSPDGAQLAAVQLDGVSVLPVAGGESRQFQGGRWVAFHPDGSHLATPDGESIAIYDWPTGRRLHTLPGPKLSWACEIQPERRPPGDDGPRFRRANLGCRIRKARGGPPAVSSTRLLAALSFR